jgi:hypothetical protein
MVNLPRGQEVSGLHGAPSQLQGEILRLVRLDGLSVNLKLTPVIWSDFLTPFFLFDYLT